MPFIDIIDDKLQKIGSAHINLGGKRNREATYCPFCAREGLRQLSSALCDAKVARGTCDAPICTFHAQHVGTDTDYCPNHRQSTLFDGVTP
jgi:hypothetical protein